MLIEQEVSAKIPFTHCDGESFDTAFLKSDLPEIIQNMKHERTWGEGELNSRILLNSPAKKIILTILHEKTEIRFFQSNDSITFQVIEGKLKLHLRKGSVNLYKGEMLKLSEKIKYSFDSVEETVFLLTIASGT